MDGNIMVVRWVDIPISDGGRFKGCLAIPAAGTAPGILVGETLPSITLMKRWAESAVP
jgi:hypothetical protein